MCQSPSERARVTTRTGVRQRGGYSNIPCARTSGHRNRPPLGDLGDKHHCSDTAPGQRKATRTEMSAGSGQQGSGEGMLRRRHNRENLMQAETWS